MDDVFCCPRCGHIIERVFGLTPLQLRAAISRASKPEPKLIGWRTGDYLHETSDRAVAISWQGNSVVLPVFEGDPNTSLRSARQNGTESGGPVAP